MKDIAVIPTSDLTGRQKQTMRRTIAGLNRRTWFYNFKYKLLKR